MEIFSLITFGSLTSGQTWCYGMDGSRAHAKSAKHQKSPNVW